LGQRQSKAIAIGVQRDRQQITKKVGHKLVARQTFNEITLPKKTFADQMKRKKSNTNASPESIVSSLNNSADAVFADSDRLANFVAAIPMSSVPMPQCLSRWTGFALGWVSGLGLQFYEAALAPLHLRAGQLAILTLLNSEGAVVQARLSERLQIDKATMVSLLNDLEQQGLIERRPHTSDRRAFEVHLLELGQQRIKQAEHVSAAATKRFFGVLSADEQQTLHTLLSRLATGESLQPPSA
jgi:MarR family transcriptional regulator, lower aerobic nicotinate degradation pathway regulator